MRVRRKSLSGAQLRNGTSIDVDQRAGRIPIGLELSEPGRRVAERADKPQGISRTPARAVGHTGGGSADDGHAEDLRCAIRKSDRIAADQGQAVAFTRMLDAGEEFVVPSLGLRQAHRKQGASR